jgi:hypothetical protein
MVIQGIAGQSGQNYYLVAYQPCIYGGMMHVFTIMGHCGKPFAGNRRIRRYHYCTLLPDACKKSNFMCRS